MQNGWIHIVATGKDLSLFLNGKEITCPANGRSLNAHPLAWIKRLVLRLRKRQ